MTAIGSAGAAEKRVFISYARADGPAAEQISAALRARGLAVEIDVTSLRAGDDFSQKLDAMIRASDCLVVIWSRQSVASDWVRAEAQRAHTLHKAIVPVRIDDSDIPLPFSVLHTLSFTSGSQEQLAAIAAAVEGRGADSNKVTPPPPPRFRWLRIAAVVAAASSAAGGGWLLLRPRPLPPDVQRAIASSYSEDHCTTSGDKIFQCVYPNAELCQFNVGSGLRCKERPPILHCTRPASADRASINAASCYLTKAACAAASEDCVAIEIPLRRRTDVPSGAPDPATLKAETSLYRKPWVTVFGESRRLITSFATEDACAQYIARMPGDAHRCIARPSSLHCRYGAMMFSSGREIDCFPSHAECADPAPRDAPCAELVLQADDPRRPTRTADWIQRGEAGFADGGPIDYHPLKVTPGESGHRIVVSHLSSRLSCRLEFAEAGDPAALSGCRLDSDAAKTNGDPDTATVRPARIHLECEAQGEYQVCLGRWTHTWSGGGEGGGGVKFRLKHTT